MNIKHRRSRVSLFPPLEEEEEVGIGGGSATPALCCVTGGGRSGVGRSQSEREGEGGLWESSRASPQAHYF